MGVTTFYYNDGSKKESIDTVIASTSFSNLFELVRVDIGSYRTRSI